MESRSLSEKVAEPPPHRWASLLGTTIAVLTLTLPLFIIAYFSSINRLEPPSPAPYSNQSLMQPSRKF